MKVIYISGISDCVWFQCFNPQSAVFAPCTPPFMSCIYIYEQGLMMEAAPSPPQMSIIWGRIRLLLLCVCEFKCVCMCVWSQPCVLGCFMRLWRLQLVWAEARARGGGGGRVWVSFRGTIFKGGYFNKVHIKAAIKVSEVYGVEEEGKIITGYYQLLRSTRQIWMFTHRERYLRRDVCYRVRKTTRQDS